MNTRIEHKLPLSGQLIHRICQVLQLCRKWSSSTYIHEKLTVYMLYNTSSSILNYTMGNSTPNFKQIRSRTIQKRDQSVQKFIPVFKKIIADARITPERIDQITRLDLVGLAAELNRRTITSEQLIAIFGQRAATIGRLNCIITEDYFEYALKRANECDQQRAKTGKMNWTLNDEWDMNKFFPPLFGIPTSVKDNIEMEGTRSTIGLTIRADRFLKEDCGTIKCFKLTGLIPFIKTNLPQLAFNFDSANHLWGRTLNPWNAKKSAGGSSGGEGAAIAARVSPVGIGNDMGGSIRIPAAFNGVFGLLVSGDRLPFKGQMTKYSTGFTGMDTIKAVNGPLSQSVDSLALWLRQMTIQQFYLGEHDAYKKLIPFDFKLYKQISEKKGKYRIGFIESFQIIEPTLANRRALNQTKKFLQNQGHTTLEVKIPHESQLLMAFFGEMVGEGNFTSFKDMLQGEQLMEQYEPADSLTSKGWLSYHLYKMLVSSKYPRLGNLVNACRNLTAHQYLENVGKIHEFKDQWIKYWRNQKLDYLIMPGFATQASNHGDSKDGLLFATYTYVLNLLGMVSCSQPITVTREDQLHYQSKWQDPVTQLIRNNLKDAQGMPVSIQVVGLPFSEEKVLGLSKRIEKNFKFYQNHPLPNV